MGAPVNTLDAVVMDANDKMDDMETEASELANLIIQYAEKHNTSFRQMSLDAGLGESTVSLFIRGDRKAGLEFCRKISSILGITTEHALRLAGQLEESPSFDSEQQAMLNAVRAVPRELRSAALAMLHGLSGAASPVASAPADRQTTTVHLDTAQQNMVQLLYRAHGLEPPEGSRIEVTAELVGMLLEQATGFQALLKPLWEAVHGSATPAERNRLARMILEERERDNSSE